MEETLLREISEKYLVPFFSGAVLLPQSEPSTARDALVVVDPLNLRFKIEKSDRYRLVLHRKQPFATGKQAVVPEHDVVQAFVAVVGRIASGLKTDLKHDLLSTFQRRVVARAIYGEEYEGILLDGIDQLNRWGTRLYEGAPVSAALGYRNVQRGSEITLSDISAHDFAHVLSNGYDSMIELNFEGSFLGHKSLPQNVDAKLWAPFRQVQIAEWTTLGSATSDRRVAMTLNRLGEILVYRGGQLLFARRSGIWHFLTHGPVIRQMSPPKHPYVRAAVYQTCLDASFARTGACIGVVDNRSSADLLKLVNKDDFLANGSSIKSKTLRHSIARKRFQDIDRILRQELVAIDGATLLSRQGEILAIGAILRIPSGSSGGGRRAAAVELSKHGLGIKVSQDGGISGFRAGDNIPSFRIM